MKTPDRPRRRAGGGVGLRSGTALTRHLRAWRERIAGRAPALLGPPPLPPPAAPGAPAGRRVLRALMRWPRLGRPLRHAARLRRRLRCPVASLPAEILDPAAGVRSAALDAGIHLCGLGRHPRDPLRDPLVRMLLLLRPWVSQPLHLHLIAWRGSARQRRCFRARLQRLGLHDLVHLPPVAAGQGGGDAAAAPSSELRAVMEACQVLVCTARPRGAASFVGRVRARARELGLPLVAAPVRALRNDLGTSGVLYPEPGDPAGLAAAVYTLINAPRLRIALRAGAQGNAPSSSTPPLDIRIEGPFDSSFSLAQVNAEMALALADTGQHVGLWATEGPGDYLPDPVFLSAHPRLAELWHATAATPEARNVLRNLYPPRLSDMRGELRGLSAYGWEESEFPAEWVEAFNRHLDVVTVMSEYVARVLVDNGVRVPIYNVGLGADHILRHAPRDPGLGPRAGFRFLHISSAFPRKGVDVLLEAYARAFSADDAVTLVLKVHPNPHHDTPTAVADWRERHPHAPAVQLIDDDLAPAELRGLYEYSDALVAPSRGEGFGLPLAEAMLLGLPVITTAHGGALDFCCPRTAWLVAGQVQRARSHFHLFGSVWANPDPDELARQMQAVYHATPEARSRRTGPARQRIAREFTWERTAGRLAAALEDCRRGPRIPSPPRVGWVSTFNSACGIAEYSRYLLQSWPDDNLVIYANRDATPLQPDPPRLRRVWCRKHLDPDLDPLRRALEEDAIDVLVVQFNFGFFELERLGGLLDHCARRDIPVAVVLHATADVYHDGCLLSLRAIRTRLALARRLYVHGLADLQYLHALGLGAPATRLPHGAPPLQSPSVDPQPGLLATFGFLLPHKGLVELVEALALLRAQHAQGARGPVPRLLMLNSLHPDPQSEAEHRRLQERIHRLGLDATVELVTEHLDEATILMRLQQAEWIVFPYQDTQESSSAAVRLGLASGRPVACTPHPIFDDLEDAVWRLPGSDPEALAGGLATCLGTHPEAGVAARQRAWLAAHAWPRITARLVAWRDHSGRSG